MRLYDEDDAERAFLKDVGSASHRIVASFPDGKLSEPFATRLYGAIRAARARGIEVLAKCCDYEDLSEDWRTFTWQSDDAVFPWSSSTAASAGTVCRRRG